MGFRILLKTPNQFSGFSVTLGETHTVVSPLKMGYAIAMLDYQRVYAPTSAGFDLQGALKSLKVDRSVEPVSQEHFPNEKKRGSTNILG